MENEIKKVNRITKQHLILLVHKTLPGMDYAQMHKTVKQFQNVLIEKYGVTLGYMFCDPSIHQCWDDKLQEDLERYNGMECLTKDVETPVAGGATYNHSLSIDEERGGFTFDRLGKYNLEDVFNKKGIVDELSKELLSIKS